MAIPVPTTVTIMTLTGVTPIQYSLCARNAVNWFVCVRSFQLSLCNRTGHVLLLSSIYWWRNVGVQNFKPGFNFWQSNSRGQLKNIPPALSSPFSTWMTATFPRESGSYGWNHYRNANFPACHCNSPLTWQLQNSSGLYSTKNGFSAEEQW